MAPPVTPSPHRFVIKKDQSALANSQFKATPRFNLSSTPQPNSTFKHLKPASYLSNYDTPSNKFLRRNESIEIESESPPGSNESLREDTYKCSFEDEGDYTSREKLTAKRKRQSSSPGLLDQPIEQGSRANLFRDDSENDPLSNTLPEPTPLSEPKISPLLTKRPIAARAPRFIISSPSPIPSSQFVNETSVFAKPPIFRPPDTTKQNDHPLDPEHDQFSPHRRGEKYVKGGLAAEVRNWLVNIKSSLPGPQMNNKDPWLVRISIEEFSGGGKAGMTIVRGKKLQTAQENISDILKEVKIILAGEASPISLQKYKSIEIGSTVGIRGPIWEVTIEGEKWDVGVDWKVL
ncbi:hypothetical protein GcM1_243092 [Golovinomyces cichoracearum]|uniref:Uncharacterized protein n=1 Tax=Golovinomyces cichoracearum TaxID=62708 RepID=A0A420IGH4_9PEZI|nr:hypothetical protein GcM1_243092 [Golovinomyces cichoracearum]